MRILEVRDGFVKFESENKLALSSFILIDDALKSYIAQVIQVKRAGENSIIYAKLLYLYNGTFIDYDKTLPSIDAKISVFDYEKLSKDFEIQEPIIVGSFLDNEQNICIDKKWLNKKMLVCVDSYEINKTITANLANQFEKSLIIDTVGIFDKNKYVAGADFKLPLNTDALEFMYEDCLNDATTDSKSLIKEIFQDLSDYSKTVPFLPFAALKTIVDDMVDKSHIFKLLVLKNKLAKFDKLGYFAANVGEVECLKRILSSKNGVIDLSKLDVTFQNRYLDIILSTVEKQGLNTHIFVVASNVINKKTLKKVLTGNCSTTFVTHSRFKFINEIKSMFKNFIIEPTFVNNETFKAYSVFLNSMPQNSYLVVGEGSRYIPLVSLTKELSFDSEPEVVDLEEELNKTDSILLEESEQNLEPSVKAINEKSNDLIEKVSEEVSTDELPEDLNLFGDDSEEPEVLEDLSEQVESNDLDEEMLEETSVIEEESSTEVIEEIEEYHTRVDESQTVEIPDDISDFTDELENEEVESGELTIEPLDVQEEEPLQDLEQVQEFEQEEALETIQILDTEKQELEDENVSFQEVSEIIPLEYNSSDEELGEIVELDETEITEQDILVEIDDSISENLDTEELDKAIVEDVDKVFTTIKEDSISDSDLDFIDELNSSLEENDEVLVSDGMEELPELQEVVEESDELLEPIEEIQEYSEKNEEKEILETRNASTPIVPVYNAEIPQEDLVLSDPIEQGDVVVHAKYGNGVVEKMIKYGTKTLYSINFDNVGRRLLDPTLTELKKA